MAKTREREDEGGGKKKFKYRGYDSGEVKKASTTSSSDFDNYLTVQGFKPKEGENKVRILPRSWDDVEKYGHHWGMPIFVHYRLGSEGSTYLCLKHSDDAKSCPACEAAASAKDEDESKKLRAKKRILCYIIDRNDEKAGPQPWSMPVTLYKDINARVEKVSSKMGDIKIDHPDDGYDITFDRDGTDEYTKYGQVDVERDSEPLNENEKKAAKWLKVLDETPLPDVLQYYDEDHLDRILSGGMKTKKKKHDEDEDDDDEDEEDTKAKKKGKAGKGKSRDDDDDDDEDDDDEPKSKKGKSKKSSKDDEDDDDEDDDDDDDEDEPKAKSKKGKSKKSDDDEDDDDDDDEDDDDEPKSKKGKSKKSSKDDEDDDDETEEEVEEEDDEDDDDEPKSKKGKSKKSDDDEDDDDSDDEDDDDEPKKGKGGTASSRAKKKLESLKRRRGGK